MYRSANLCSLILFIITSFVIKINTLFPILAKITQNRTILTFDIYSLNKIPYPVCFNFLNRGLILLQNHTLYNSCSKFTPSNYSIEIQIFSRYNTLTLWNVKILFF